MHMPKKKLLLIIVCLVSIAVIAVFFVFQRKADAPTTNKNVTTQKSTEEQTEQPQTGFDKAKFSIDEPGSQWWIVNKTRPLPEGYVPPDLGVPPVKLRLGESAEQMKFSGQATPALKEMFTAASNDGVTLVFGSGYRSYALQKQFYDSYVAKDGQAAADRYSARPGTSEHQTGLSFDATSISEKCHLEICFEETPEGQWIKANSYKYGFIIRYSSPEKEKITGYQYEPWHLRYVGVDLAAELQKTGQTIEEFFGLN